MKRYELNWNIELALKAGRRIGICPYGKNAERVVQTLRAIDPFSEPLLIDNYKEGCISVKELIEKKDEYKSIVVLLTPEDDELFNSLKEELSDAGIDINYIGIPCIYRGLESKENKAYAQMRWLLPRHAIGTEYERIGRENDGGYIMLDDFSGTYIAYSFGISEDVSWDMDMAKRGLDVYMYDHTINSLPQDNMKFHFFKTGIAKEDSENKELKSFQTLLHENGHETCQNLILKMDVEGAEYDVFDGMPLDIIDKFRQITIEFHGLCFDENLQKRVKVFEKLNLTHQPVWVHGNNWDYAEIHDGLILPNAVEVTFANRRIYKFDDYKVNIPLELDMPNKPEVSDFNMENWLQYSNGDNENNNAIRSN